MAWDLAAMHIAPTDPAFPHDTRVDRGPAKEALDSLDLGTPLSRQIQSTIKNAWREWVQSGESMPKFHKYLASEIVYKSPIPLDFDAAFPWWPSGAGLYETDGHPIKPLAASLKDTLEKLGPQTASDARAIIDWARGLPQSAAAAMSLMKSMDLISPSDVCDSRTAAQCCRAHLMASALLTQLVSLKSEYDSAGIKVAGSTQVDSSGGAYAFTFTLNGALYTGLRLEIPLHFHPVSRALPTDAHSLLDGPPRERYVDLIWAELGDITENDSKAMDAWLLWHTQP